MSYESTAAPIKIGYLMDLRLPAFYPQEMRDDLTRSLELVFSEGVQQRIIDRPVEIAFREVEGLPKGTVKAVIDAFGELVDEGCAPPAAAGRAALRRRRGSRRRPRPRGLCTTSRPRLPAASSDACTASASTCSRAVVAASTKTTLPSVQAGSPRSPGVTRSSRLAI
jgi:hypothetical protein